MLKAQEIVNGLQTIVNEYSMFSTLWHVAFYILIIALLAKWKPSNELFTILLCLPLLSVAVFAWTAGNPFNGILFSIATILIFIFGFKAPGQPVDFSQGVFWSAGIFMIAFGLVYPHFLETNSVFKYLYASPVGLIPCPTLSILIGFALLFNGFGSNAITLTLIVFGLFYGIFGALKLAVHLDFFLVLGTVTLLVKYIFSLRAV